MLHGSVWHGICVPTALVTREGSRGWAWLSPIPAGCSSLQPQRHRKGFGHPQGACFDKIWISPHLNRREIERWSFTSARSEQSPGSWRIPAGNGTQPWSWEWRHGPGTGNGDMALEPEMGTWPWHWPPGWHQGPSRIPHPSKPNGTSGMPWFPHRKSGNAQSKANLTGTSLASCLSFPTQKVGMLGLAQP